MMCVTIAVKDQDAVCDGLQRSPVSEARGQVWSRIRFLTECPSKEPDLQVVLASWFSKFIGKNPTAVLYTEDSLGTCDELRDRGVVSAEAPPEKPFDLQAIFKDLYGNGCALLGPGASRG
jgi:hypothetical protein